MLPVALRSSRGEHRSLLFLTRIFALYPRLEALATRISVAESFSGLWRVNHILLAAPHRHREEIRSRRIRLRFTRRSVNRE